MPVPAVLDREMGCTREEFVRWIAGATRGAPMRVDAGGVTVAVGSGRVEISLREAAPRRLARLAVPVLMVRFRFVELGDDARERFLASFDGYTRRGGG